MVNRYGRHQGNWRMPGDKEEDKGTHPFWERFKEPFQRVEERVEEAERGRQEAEAEAAQAAQRAEFEAMSPEEQQQAMEEQMAPVTFQIGEGVIEGLHEVPPEQWPETPQAGHILEAQTEEWKQEQYAELEELKGEHEAELYATIEADMDISLAEAYATGEGVPLAAHIAEHEGLAEIDRWYRDSITAIDEGAVQYHALLVGGNDLKKFAQDTAFYARKWKEIFTTDTAQVEMLGSPVFFRGRLIEAQTEVITGLAEGVTHEQAKEAYDNLMAALQAEFVAIGTPDNPGSVTESLIAAGADDADIEDLYAAGAEVGSFIDALVAEWGADEEAFKKKYEQYRGEPPVPDYWVDRIGWSFETGGGPNLLGWQMDFLGGIGRMLVTSGPGQWVTGTLDRFNKVWWGEKSWAAHMYGWYTVLPGHQPGEEKYEDIHAQWMMWPDPTKMGEMFAEEREVYEEVGEPSSWALELTHPLWLATLGVGKVAGGIAMAPRVARIGAEIARMGRYTRFAAEHPKWAIRFGRVGTGLERAAIGLDVGVAPVRAAIWTGSVGANVVHGIVALPFKGAMLPARGALRGLEYAGTVGEFTTLQGIGRGLGTGFELKWLRGATAAQLKHPYRVTGNGIDVLYRDLREVQSLFARYAAGDGRVLAAESENFYVPALKRIVSASELQAMDLKAIAVQQAGKEMPQTVAGAFEAIGESVYRSYGLPHIERLGVGPEMLLEGAQAFNTRRMLMKMLPKKLFVETKNLDEMLALGFRDDAARKAAGMIAEMPGPIGSIVRECVGLVNRAAVAKSELVQVMIAWGRMREVGHLTVGAAIAPIRHMGNPMRVFGIKEVTVGGRVYKALCDPKMVRLKEGFQDLGVRIGNKVYHPIGDVIEHPYRYALTDKQMTMIQAYHRYMDELLEVARKNGVDLKEMGFAEGDHYFPRWCLGKDGITIEAKTPIKEYFGAKKQPFDLSRVFDEQAMGIQLGWQYEGHVVNILEGTARAIYNRIADKQAHELLVSKYGLTEAQAREILAPGLKSYVDGLARGIAQLEQAEGTLVAAMTAGKVPGGSMAALRKNFPELATRLKDAMGFRPKKVADVIAGLRKEMKGQAAQNLAGMKDAIRVVQALREPTAKELGTVTMKDVANALKLARGQTEKEVKRILAAWEKQYIDAAKKGALMEVPLTPNEIRAVTEKAMRAALKNLNADADKAFTQWAAQYTKKGKPIPWQAKKAAPKASAADIKWFAKYAQVSEKQLAAALREAQPALTKQVPVKVPAKFSAADLRAFALAMGIDYQTLRAALRVAKTNPAMKTITFDDIDQALRLVGADMRTSINMATRLYELEAQISMAEYRDMVSKMLNGVRWWLGEAKTAKTAADAQLADVRSRVSAVTQWTPDAKKIFEKAGLPEEPARRVQESFAFAGSIWPQESARGIDRYLGDRGNRFIHQMAKAQAVPRFAMTGVDWGYFMIQGLPSLAMNPEAFARAMNASIRSFFQPGYMDAYLSSAPSREVMARLVPHGLLVGAPATEFTEAMFGGWLGKGLGLLGRDVGGGRVSLATLPNAYARGFEAFGTAARIEMGRALLPRATTVAEEKMLADFLNKMTGVTSSRALGIGRTQRDLEAGIFFFSPRYTRASFALMLDVTRGGLRGQLAREAMASMLAAGMIYYNGLCLFLGQKPNLDPTSGKFMSVEIGGHHMGIGSIWVAMARFLGNSIQTMDENPSDFFKFNPADPYARRDNPIVRFWSGRLAPLTGTGYDILLGRTYIGEPLDSFPAYGKWVVARNLLPFYLAAAIEAGEFNVGAAGAEYMGMRTWKLTEWEQYKIRRDELSQQEYGVSWDELGLEKGKLYQDKLILKYPELEKLREKADADWVRRGDELVQLKSEYWDEGQDALEVKKRAYQYAVDKFLEHKELLLRYNDEDPTLTEEEIERALAAGDTFREALHEADAVYRGAMAARELRDRYKPVIEDRQRRIEQGDTDKYLGDLAYDDYCATFFGNPDLYEDGNIEHGSYLYDVAAEMRLQFKAKWGLGAWEYVESRFDVKKDWEPLEVREYHKAIDYLRPYFIIEEQMAGLYPDMTQEELKAWKEERIIAALEKRGGNFATVYRKMQESERYADMVRAEEWWPAVRDVIEAVAGPIRRADYPTLNRVVTAARLQWRRDHPKGDEYLMRYYDRRPLGEREPAEFEAGVQEPQLERIQSILQWR